MKKAILKVGDKVRVEPNHWLRGNQEGKIVRIGRVRFLIEFPNKHFYGGLDGNRIWLEERQFKKV